MSEPGSLAVRTHEAGGPNGRRSRLQIVDVYRLIAQ
jgi:hypothetical protein